MSVGASSTSWSTGYQLGQRAVVRCRARTWDSSHPGASALSWRKPLTYMNRSGESVRSLMDYYDIPD